MHSPTCHCTPCAEKGAAMRAFSAGDYVTYCRWLKKRDALRAAGARGELRVGIHHPEDTVTNDYAPAEFVRTCVEGPGCD